MKAATIISNIGITLSDEEFKNRRIEYNSDTTYIECFLEKGIIVLIPERNFETVQQVKPEWYDIERGDEDGSTKEV